VPEGRGLLDFIHSPNRLTSRYRAPGSDTWQPISWGDALDRIAKLMKADRDANFVEKTDDGKTVNRWLTTGMLAGSNEVGYITHKVSAASGCSHSTTRRVSDTARRWQVLPRRLAVER
jgi:formate dehydrogenase major subunit